MKENKNTFSKQIPNFTKPVWGELAMSCEESNRNSQGIASPNITNQ